MELVNGNSVDVMILQLCDYLVLFEVLDCLLLFMDVL